MSLFTTTVDNKKEELMAGISAEQAAKAKKSFQLTVKLADDDIRILKENDIEGGILIVAETGKKTSLMGLCDKKLLVIAALSIAETLQDDPRHFIPLVAGMAKIMENQIEKE